jgi:hypothetical protein
MSNSGFCCKTFNWLHQLFICRLQPSVPAVIQLLHTDNSSKSLLPDLADRSQDRAEENDILSSKYFSTSITILTFPHTVSATAVLSQNTPDLHNPVPQRIQCD